jgi:hypothetical protein
MFHIRKVGYEIVANVKTREIALIAQTVEHVLGKNGVRGSIPLEGSWTEKNQP